MTSTLKIQKNTLFKYTALVLVAVAVIAAFLLLDVGSTQEKSLTGNAVQQGADAQKITLGLKDYNYHPNTIRVKANQPVEITLDETVVGCLRAFTIKDLGVSKASRSPEDTIIFTPTKKGSFTFACSMGMGYGTIVVE